MSTPADDATNERQVRRHKEVELFSLEADRRQLERKCEDAKSIVVRLRQDLRQQQLAVEEQEAHVTQLEAALAEKQTEINRKKRELLIL